MVDMKRTVKSAMVNRDGEKRKPWYDEDSPSTEVDECFSVCH
jgi:hypothetical protein